MAGPLCCGGAVDIDSPRKCLGSSVGIPAFIRAYVALAVMKVRLFFAGPSRGRVVAMSFVVRVLRINRTL